MTIRPFVEYVNWAVHLGFYFQWFGGYELGIAVGPLIFGLRLTTRNLRSKVVHGDRKGWAEV